MSKQRNSLSHLQIHDKPVLNINRLPIDNTIEVDIDGDVSWLQNYLEDLNKELDDEELFKISEPSTFKVHFKLTHKVNSSYKEHLLLKAQVNGHYYRPCVRCLWPAKININIDVNFVFLDQSLEELPEFNDLDTAFVSNEEYQILYYENKQIDLLNFLNEEIQLSTGPLPLHDENCKGLCQKCGHNLNEGSCGH